MSKPTKSPARPRAKKSSTTPRVNQTAQAMSQIAGALAQLNKPTAIMSEPMVGIRNISNYVIGLRSPFADEADVQLAAPRYERDEPMREMVDPNMVAQVSEKWWRQLRRDRQVAKGMIVRDDSVLSKGTTRAEADVPGDIPAGAAINAIPNPIEWIESKTEQELKDALAALTAEESLRRLLTCVNQRIEHERVTLKVTDDMMDEKREAQALKNLPWRYKIAEEVVLERLERDFYGREAV